MPDLPGLLDVSVRLIPNSHVEVHIGTATVMVYQPTTGDAPSDYFVIEVDADNGERFKFYGDPISTNDDIGDE